MKNTTISKLNLISAKIADFMIFANRHENVQKNRVDDGSKKLDTFKCIKFTILKNSMIFNQIAGDLTNVKKTTQQFNYLINEVLNKIRRNSNVMLAA